MSPLRLQALVLCADEKILRVLRRVLSDLEIVIDHCTESDAAIHKLTRQRYEAIIVDCANALAASQVLRSARTAPCNKRAVAVAILDPKESTHGAPTGRPRPRQSRPATRPAPTPTTTTTTTTSSPQPPFFSFLFFSFLFFSSLSLSLNCRLQAHRPKSRGSVPRDCSALPGTYQSHTVGKRCGSTGSRRGLARGASRGWHGSSRFFRKHRNTRNSWRNSFRP